MRQHGGNWRTFWRAGHFIRLTRRKRFLSFPTTNEGLIRTRALKNDWRPQRNTSPATLESDPRLGRRQIPATWRREPRKVFRVPQMAVAQDDPERRLRAQRPESA
jgi:hypothetical protein